MPTLREHLATPNPRCYAYLSIQACSLQVNAMYREISETAIRLTTTDGLRLHVRLWSTEKSPEALVLVVHGVLEHAGRYAEMATYLNRAGIAVWALDLRGHGRSSGSRVWTDHFDRYLDDVSLVLDEARTAYPELPIYLFGHSMGGLIVLQPRLARTHSPAGLILSAPSIHVADEFIPWLRKFAAFGSRWFPWARLARMRSSSMSRDKAVVDDYRSDPLVHHGRIPTRTGAEIIRAGEETRQQADRIKLPLLVLQGTADAVVLPDATEALYHSAGSGDKTLRLYQGLYHDLPREPEKEQIFTEITSWLLARCR